MPIIEVKNVTHYYEESPALRDISFSVEEGEFVALVGKNGSGKSTIAKLLNGLMLPTKGEVVSVGFDTRDEAHIYDVRRGVGVVFQNPDNQMVATIIEDDIAFGAENLGLPPEEIERRITYALEAVDMTKHRHGTASRLSGGQKQRIAIAGILAMRPRVLVLDESTSMLDPSGRQNIIKVARQLNEQGITVILITHYMDEAAQCDKIIVLEKGKIVLSGGKEIFDNPDIASYGLEMPIACAVASDLRKQGIKLPLGILTPDDLIEKLLPLVGGEND